MYHTMRTILLVEVKLWPGLGALMGDRRGAYKVLVGNPEGKRPLGRPRHR